MKNLLKKLAMICLISSSTFTTFAAVQNMDKIVVIINDDVITRSELDAALTRSKMQNFSDQTAAAGNGKQQVLNQLINKKLQLQMAKQLGVEIPESDINQAINSVAQQNNLSVQDLYQHLKQENLSVEDYRQEIREQMTLQKVQQQEIASKVRITPEEVSAFLKSKTWQTNGEKEYRIEDILLPLNDEPSSDEVVQVKKQALDVLSKLRSKQTFSTPNLQREDLGWRKLPEIPSAFSEQVTQMKVNDYAGPIQTANGFHIIKLAKVKAIGGQQPNRKQVEELLLQQKFEEAVKGWVTKLRGQATILYPEKKLL